MDKKQISIKCQQFLTGSGRIREAILVMKNNGVEDSLIENIIFLNTCLTEVRPTREEIKQMVADTTDEGERKTECEGIRRKYRMYGLCYSCTEYRDYRNANAAEEKDCLTALLASPPSSTVFFGLNSPQRNQLEATMRSYDDLGPDDEAAPRETPAYDRLCVQVNRTIFRIVMEYGRKLAVEMKDIDIPVCRTILDDSHHELLKEAERDAFTVRRGAVEYLIDEKYMDRIYKKVEMLCICAEAFLKKMGKIGGKAENERRRLASPLWGAVLSAVLKDVPDTAEEGTPDMITDEQWQQDGVAEAEELPEEPAEESPEETGEELPEEVTDEPPGELPDEIDEEPEESREETMEEPTEELTEENAADVTEDTSLKTNDTDSENGEPWNLFSSFENMTEEPVMQDNATEEDAMADCDTAEVSEEETPAAEETEEEREEDRGAPAYAEEVKDTTDGNEEKSGAPSDAFDIFGSLDEFGLLGQYDREKQKPANEQGQNETEDEPAGEADTSTENSSTSAEGVKKDSEEEEKTENPVWVDAVNIPEYKKYRNISQKETDQLPMLLLTARSIVINPADSGGDKKELFVYIPKEELRYRIGRDSTEAWNCVLRAARDRTDGYLKVFTATDYGLSKICYDNNIHPTINMIELSLGEQKKKDSVRTHMDDMTDADELQYIQTLAACASAGMRVTSDKEGRNYIDPADKVRGVELEVRLKSIGDRVIWLSIVKELISVFRSRGIFTKTGTFICKLDPQKMQLAFVSRPVTYGAFYSSLVRHLPDIVAAHSIKVPDIDYRQRKDNP